MLIMTYRNLTGNNHNSTYPVLKHRHKLAYRTDGIRDDSESLCSLGGLRVDPVDSRLRSVIRDDRDIDDSTFSKRSASE